MSSSIINIDKEIMSGIPVFLGTRVSVKNLFDYLETGESIDVFLEDFESVSREQVIKILEMSKNLLESSTHILNESFA